MLFSSLFFIYAFLPLCLISVYLSKSIRAQNIVLLIFSLVFYAWGEPRLVFLVLGTATFAWIMGLIMEQPGRTERQRKLCLTAAIFVMLTSLAAFKYLGFFITQLNHLPFVNLAVPQIALPIGISFYTFQVITYVLDLYRGEVQLQRSWYKFALYVCVFPQLVAGPIVRYKDIADQIDNRQLRISQITAGINRFLVGLAKKVLLANPLGLIATQIMDPAKLSSISVLEAWMGLIGFALQIYFDFSGYSDMAIGLGRMFGFDFKENFQYPYVAKSITDFWRRWHISLSAFFRDYVYIPLGGNRKHQYRNMLVVWALTGFWHGASWNFILWGLYFFAFLSLEKRFWRESIENAGRVVSSLYMAAIVLGGWILFYYTDLGAAGRFTLRLFGIGGTGLLNTQAKTLFANNILIYLIAFVAMTPIVTSVRRYIDQQGLRLPYYEVGEDKAADRALVVKNRFHLTPVTTVILIVVQTALLFLATASLAGSSFNPFLYFRF